MHAGEEGAAALVDLAERPEVQEKLARRIKSVELKVGSGLCHLHAYGGHLPMRGMHG